MAQDVELRCQCGEVRGCLRAASPHNGNHVVCYCADCQSFARHLGRADVLGPRGETHVFQTLSHRVELTHGAARIACLRLSPKGLMRWYATCCNTPLGNTLERNRLSFTGILVNTFASGEAQIGAVIALNGAGDALGHGPELRNFGFARAAARIMRRAVWGTLTGKGRVSPFFMRDGTPISAPKVLTLDERTKARQPT